MLLSGKRKDGDILRASRGNGARGISTVERRNFRSKIARFQRDAHVGLAALPCAMADDVGDDLLENQLGVVARGRIQRFPVEGVTQPPEGVRKPLVAARESNLDAPRVYRRCGQAGSRQPRATLPAVVASARTGTMLFSEVVSSTSATSGCAP